MQPSDSESADASRREEAFLKTNWDLLEAARSPQPHQAQEALEHLCKAYWYPLYAYLRRRGFGPEEAQDLTQGFFAHLLQSQTLQRASPENGRFRSYLLTCLNRFVHDQQDFSRRQKRGGGKVHLSLDTVSGEERYQSEPASPERPDQLFERRWALTVIGHVLRRLKREATNSGRGPVFAELQAAILGEPDDRSYAELGTRLGLTEGAVKTLVRRYRLRYRALFEEEIARTVSDPTQIRDEIQHLFRVLAGSPA